MDRIHVTDAQKYRQMLINGVPEGGEPTQKSSGLQSPWATTAEDNFRPRSSQSQARRQSNLSSDIFMKAEDQEVSQRIPRDNDIWGIRERTTGEKTQVNTTELQAHTKGR